VTRAGQRAGGELRLIHGDERHLVDAAALEWTAASRGSEMRVEVFDSSFRLEELRRSLVEVPLIDAQRWILVRDPPQLGGTVRRSAEGAEALAATLEERAPTTSVCLVAHVRVAPQNAVLVAVRRLGGEIVYRPRPKGRELRAWVDAEIAARGLRLGPGGAAHLLEVTGADLGALAGELDKLVALADGQALTTTVVREAVAGDEPVEMWSVIEDLLGSTPGRAAATVGQLLDQGRSSQHLLAVLAGQARDLLMAQAYLHTHGSGAGLAAELRVPDWRADRLARQARAVPAALVAAWLRELHDLDRRIKAGELGDADGLRLLALRAAGQVARRGRRAVVPAG
jgi:DNA polymerase-3 subunit delta